MDHNKIKYLIIATSASLLIFVLNLCTLSETGVGHILSPIDNAVKVENEEQATSDETPLPDSASVEENGSQSPVVVRKPTIPAATPSPAQTDPVSDGSDSIPAAPAPDSRLAYVVFYGDSQSDTDAEDQNHALTVGSILDSGANPVFHLGDLMEDGTLDSLNRFNAVTASLRSQRAFYAAQGNNERDSSLYFDNFIFPNNERWYSVNSGNLHVVVLDSAYSSVAVGSSQYNWLLSDLQSAASQERMTIVIFHHPPYGMGGDTKGLISTFVPLFRNHGVDLVISGHEHLYQKNTVDGVPYFISGGQPSIGYFIAEGYSGRVLLKYFSPNGVLIESINIAAR